MQEVTYYLKRWIAKKATTLAPNTLEGLASIVKRWIARIGSRPAGGLSATDVEDVELEPVRLGRSASHLNKERTYFKEFVRYLGECGVAPLPSTEIWKKRKEVVKKRYVCLSKEQEASLSEAAPEWLKAFIAFASSTGLRAGTIRQLSWAHLDNGGALNVPPEIMKARRPLRLPLSGKAFAAIGPRGDGPLFPGLPDARRLYYEFKKAVRRAPSVPQHCNVHDLRRTFVGRMLQAGAPTAVVMQLGGWSEESSLIKHYLAEVEQDAALSYLEKI